MICKMSKWVRVGVGVVGLSLAVTAQFVSANVVFSDDFEGDTGGTKPINWSYSEAAGADVSVQETPSWSPYSKVIQLYTNSSATEGGASIVKDGFNVGDFIFEMDMQNIKLDRNGILSILLTDATGASIFSGQINYHPDAKSDYFDTGIYNVEEVDQRFVIPYQDFSGNPPYSGIHLKVEVNHSAGTYDLTLGDTLYANNPLGVNVTGKNLAKIELIGGAGEANSTNVWLDNVVLTAVPEPASICLLMGGLATILSRRRR